MSVAAMIPSMLPLLIVAMMRRAENRIYRQLSDANAYTPDSAIALSPGRSIEQKRLQSLIRGGAVRMNANSNTFSIPTVGVPTVVIADDEHYSP